MFKATKYRLYPNAEQEVILSKHFGCTRFVFNWALTTKKEAWEDRKENLSRYDLSKRLPDMKSSEETEWLKEVNSQSLQAALVNLDMAYTKFFREKKGFPKFKSKHNRQSFQVPQFGVVGEDFIRLPKVGKLKAAISRPVKGKIKTITVSKTPTGKYFASVLSEIEELIPEKLPVTEEGTVGISLSISPDVAASRFCPPHQSIRKAGRMNPQLANGINTTVPFFQDASGVLAHLQNFLSASNSSGGMQLVSMLRGNGASLCGFTYLGFSFKAVILPEKGVKAPSAFLGTSGDSLTFMDRPLSASGSPTCLNADVVAEVAFIRHQSSNPEGFPFVKIRCVLDPLQQNQPKARPTIKISRSVKWEVLQSFVTLDVLRNTALNINGLPHINFTIDGVYKEVDAWEVKKLCGGFYAHAEKSHKNTRMSRNTRNLGLKHFAVLSTGESVENPRPLKKRLRRLRRAQRRLSRRKKGSNNRNKQRRRVARIHERVSNTRNDFLHKLTTRLVRDNQTDSFAIEDLAVSNMLKNHRLARSIADAGWGTFRTFLEYKSEQAGKNVLVIGRFEPSSKTDHKSGAYLPNLTLKDREILHADGTTTCRDLNAAINIKRFALHPQNFVGRDTSELIRLGRLDNNPVVEPRIP